MSLEAAIQENTSVLRELLAKLSVTVITTPTADAPAKKPVSAVSGQTTAKVEEAAAPVNTESATSHTAASAAADAQASTAATEPVTYDQVKPLILKINTVKGRDAAAAALAKFGVAKGPELKAEQYADFVAYAQEVLA